MSYFIMFDIVYISTLHMWYSLEYYIEFNCVKDYNLAVLL